MGTATIADMLIRRSVKLVPNTWDEATRSVEAVLATEKQTTVFDLRTRRSVDEILIMEGREPDDQAVIVDSHPQADGKFTTEEVRGSVRDIRAKGGQLLGRLYFADDEASLRMAGKVRDGHVRDLSIGAQPVDQEEIAPGQSITFRGKTYQAPSDRSLFITHRWRLTEVSVTPRGADPDAKVRRLSTNPNLTTTRTRAMNANCRAFLNSKGLKDDADEETARAFMANLPDVESRTRAEKLDEEGEDPEEPSDLEDDDEEGAAKKESTRAVRRLAAATTRTVPTTRSRRASRDDAETIRAEAAKTERLRIASLTKLAGDDVPAETLRKAIDEDWDEDRAARAFLQTIRDRRTLPVAGNSPAIHSRSHERDCTVRSMSTGLMLRMGTRVIDPRGTAEQQKVQADEAEQGDRYRDMPLVDICREALRLDNLRIPNARDELIREAVSSSTLSAIFTTNVNARLLERYFQHPDSTVGWCREADVANFKTQERFFMGKTADFERLPRGGAASHAATNDNLETYKIARYARQFVIDEQDIMDDSFGSLQQMPDDMGDAASRLRPSLVYAILLNNAALGNDSIALFDTSTHKNYATGAGTAFGPTSLATGLISMAKQTMQGVPLNLKARYLIVPQDLYFSAAALLKSGEIRDTTASTKYPVYNVIQETGLILVADNRIGVLGVTDPSTGPPTGTAVAGTATNWFLAAAANEAKTIEVGYLAGTGRRPQVRPFVLTEGRWGIGWDIKMDIGAKALDYRGLYLAAGA